MCSGRASCWAPSPEQPMPSPIGILRSTIGWEQSGSLRPLPAHRGLHFPVALLVITRLKQVPAPTHLRSYSPAKYATANLDSTTFWLGITAPIGAGSSARIVAQMQRDR